MLLAQYADEIGAALRIGDRFDLARMLSDAARTISYYVDAGHSDGGERVAAPRFRRAAPSRPPARSTKGSSSSAERSSWPATRGPNAIPGLILRVAAASATTGLPMAASTLEPAGRGGAGAAHAVAPAGAQGSAGDAGRRARDRGHRRGTGSNRTVGQALSRMGCGARPAAARRRAHLDGGPSPRRNRLAGKRIHHPGVAPRSAGARCTGARHRQGPRRRPQRHRRGSGDPDRHPAGHVAVRRRGAVQDRALPPAAAGHRDPARSAGPEDHRRGGRRTRRRPGAAGAVARARRGRLAGHRPRGVGRLEGLADRRPGAPLPAGDGG